MNLRASSRARLPALLPGVALSVAVALAARWAHRLLPADLGRIVGEVIVAVLFGLVVGNAMRRSARVEPGVRFSFHSVLRAAIVCLGAGFSVQQVGAIGVKALVLVLVLMSIALVVAHALGRAARIPGRLATLIGVGTAVCGNSAIVASAPVIGARDEDVSFAVATNTLFGTLAVFLYPLLGRALGLDEPAFGTWAGTAVNDTSQVVATGFAFGEEAGRVATAVKLTRNALMGAVILGLGLYYGRLVAPAAEAAIANAPPCGGAGPSGSGARGASGLSVRLRQSVPGFVIGFLALAALRSIGFFSWLGSIATRDVVADLQTLARNLILVALAGVGLSTRIDAMRRIGLRPLLVGFATATVTAVTSYALIRVAGPAGTLP